MKYELSLKRREDLLTKNVKPEYYNSIGAPGGVRMNRSGSGKASKPSTGIGEGDFGRVGESQITFNVGL
jgi:hypothetical protein